MRRKNRPRYQGSTNNAYRILPAENDIMPADLNDVFQERNLINSRFCWVTVTFSTSCGVFVTEHFVVVSNNFVMRLQFEA